MDWLRRSQIQKNISTESDWKSMGCIKSIQVWNQRRNQLKLKPQKTYHLSQAERAWDASSQSMFEMTDRNRDTVPVYFQTGVDQSELN